MKGLIIGLAAGMAAGALISANFSEVRKLAKKAGNAVGMKPKGGMQSGGMQSGANILGAASAANAQQMQNSREPAGAAGAWVCSCGAQNTGNFCTNCGKPRPSAAWTCSCGTMNTGNFCSNCGKPRQ